MKKIGYISIVIVLLHMCIFGSNSNRENIWAQFSINNPGNSYIRWGENSMAPKTVYGFKSEQYLDINSPVEIARLFIEKNNNLFRIDVDRDNLKLLRINSVQGVQVVDFTQYYDGYRVLGGEYSVAINSDKTVHMAGGNYYFINSIEKQISINQKLLNNIISNYLNIEENPELDFEIVINPLEIPHISYFVELDNLIVIINAKTGEIELTVNKVLNVNGTGEIYPIDPSNSNITTVTIFRLLGGGFRPIGTYIDSKNQELGYAFNFNRDFRYQPPNYTQHDYTHFDDINVYYHIDIFSHEYWPELGYSGLGTQINSVVHKQVNGSHDNAGAYLGINELRFGHGESVFWDLAKKDDVIYHEYTHLISNQIGLDIYQTEERAMHEGYSDYHAASFTNDHFIGEWVTRNYPELRRLNTDPEIFNYSSINSISYPLNPIGSPHANGMIWSGSLWDLRNELGEETANFLIYMGLVYKHISGTTFLDGREGILIADDTFYNGTHENEIMEVFANRGIGDPPISPLSLTIVGPTSLSGGQYGTFLAEATGGTENYTNYRWWKRNDGGIEYDLPIGEWFEMPSWEGLHTIQTRGWSDFSLKCEVTESDGNIDLDVHSVRVSSGSSNPKIAENYSDLTPDEYALYTAYPNPFNPITNIKIDIPENSHIKLTVFDLSGRLVAELMNQNITAGTHKAIWNGKDNKGRQVSSGVYLYTIMATSNENGKYFSKSNKMVLLK